MKVIINKLYQVFNKYTVLGNLRDRSCDCCVTDNEIRELLSKPLKELSADEIGHFMRSATTTFGNVTDYKHFLPRILELLLDQKTDLVFDFMCFEKLNYSEWETWPLEEQKALDDYFVCFWKEVIFNESSADNQIEGVFQLISKYGNKITALEIWLEATTQKSTVFLVDAYLYNTYSRLFENDFDTITKWLTSKPVLQKIETAFFKEQNNDTANRISIVHTMLENQI